jgi:diguanylate cyclase (GGDEF)-like protein
LATLPAQPRERRFAVAVVLASCLGFALAAPFARVALPQAPVFIAVYQSTLAICDFITAVLLLGQFAMLRSPSLLVLGSGYLFTALIAVVHGLSFPGLFAPTGLLPATAQSTAWLYMLWHVGFPLAVLYYATHEKRLPLVVRPGKAIAVAVLAVALVIAALTVLATVGVGLLPEVMDGNHYTSAMLGVVSLVWLCSLAALVALWRRSPHSVLDVWLMVVMCAWLFDVALSAVLNAGRYDLGFYAGRIYGLAAAGFVLVVLLLETFALYAKLAVAHDRLRDQAKRDGLTGIFNRRYLDEQLDAELLRCRRQQQQISLLMIDVDHFKMFNDRYGHVSGDACLRSVASAIAGAVKRPGDLAARYGGEEFAVVLPDTDARGALEVAKQIRGQVAHEAIPHAGNAAGRVTISIGVATRAATTVATAEELIQLADSALYRAKAAGRDGVHVEEGPASVGAADALGQAGLRPVLARA